MAEVKLKKAINWQIKKKKNLKYDDCDEDRRMPYKEGTLITIKGYNGIYVLSNINCFDEVAAARITGPPDDVEDSDNNVVYDPMPSTVTPCSKEDAIKYFYSILKNTIEYHQIKIKKGSSKLKPSEIAAAILSEVECYSTA